MNSTGRALLGAIVGTLLTLSAHPLTRPYLWAFFHTRPIDRIVPQLETPQGRFPNPKNIDDAARWVEVAARKSLASGLTKSEVTATLAVINEAAQRDRGNAYWKQLRAVFLNLQGHREAASSAWSEAGLAGTWNDYQTPRLIQAQSMLAREYGAPQAWQYAYVYFHRTNDSVTLITKYARNLLSHAPMDRVEGVDIRVATIRNGNRIRNGARSVRQAIPGADLIELAAYPPDLVRSASPKALYLGRIALVNTLRSFNRQNEGAELQRIFSDTEGWRYLLQTEDPDARISSLTWNAAATFSAGGMLLFIAVCGGLSWLAGLALEQSTRASTRLAAVPAVCCAIALGAAVFAATFFPIVAASTALSFLFLVVGPSHVRRARPSDLGPFFSFTVACVAIAFAFTSGLYVAGTTAAVRGVLSAFGAAPELYGGSSLFVGLSAIIFGVLFLVAPMWALVQRLGTPFVLGLALKRFGIVLGLGGLFAAAVLTPLAWWTDLRLSSTLAKIVGNEPVYYLLHEP
jgi:hypothetical protein